MWKPGAIDCNPSSHAGTLLRSFQLARSDGALSPGMIERIIIGTSGCQAGLRVGRVRCLVSGWRPGGSCAMVGCDHDPAGPCPVDGGRARRTIRRRTARAGYCRAAAGCDAGRRGRGPGRAGGRGGWVRAGPYDVRWQPGPGGRCGSLAADAGCGGSGRTFAGLGGVSAPARVYRPVHSRCRSSIGDAGAVRATSNRSPLLAPVTTPAVANGPAAASTPGAFTVAASCGATPGPPPNRQTTTRPGAVNRLFTRLLPTLTHGTWDYYT
jgi:hypothetical protein